jgi:RNA polymerase sigma factor (sigma-70 family)
MTAVRHRVQNLHAHQRVKTATEEAVAQDRLEPPGLGQAASLPSAAVESRELEAIYRQATADLNAQDRTVVVLRWEKGYSFEAIAQALGISKNGARHILLRAERLVQRRFAEYRR